MRCQSVTLQSKKSVDSGVRSKLSDEIGYIKKRTLELYSQLPIDCEEGRKSRIDIRDELVIMHDRFIHKMAQNTYLDNNKYTYEDIYQQTRLEFIEIWWWFKYPPKYKSTVGFTSYFYQRIIERTIRALSELSYSMCRSTFIKCADLLGLPHWNKLKPEMLSQIEGHYELVQLCLRLMNNRYRLPIEEHQELKNDVISSTNKLLTYLNDPSDERRLLISEMIYRESSLSEKELDEISEMYSIPLSDLLPHLELAKIELYNILKDVNHMNHL